MAKIVRFNGNLVAPASAALGTERTLFGSASQADDLTSQFTADLLRGWGIVGPSDQPTLQDFNAMGYTLGHLHAYLHQVGVPEWNTLQEYHIGSIANVAGVLYFSLINTNVGNNPASSPAQWSELYPQATESVRGTGVIADNATAVAGVNDTELMTPLKTAAAIAALASNTLDTTRISVPSAATIDLTASAPNTRHINITGTATVTAFTVAAGKCYFVRFDAAMTLTNNAGIVTQRGANIVTAAGDTCIIRATATNVVEVLCYTRATPQALGDGQTLQAVTGSRALNTNYTNTTGRPIYATVRVLTAAGSAAFNRIGIQIDGGVEYFSEGTPGAGANFTLCATGIIPPGAVYRANINNASLVDWTELRT